MEGTLSVELTPSEADAFLLALQDDSPGGYRERLTLDPRPVLAEHRILISEELAGNAVEWPSVEEVQMVRARTTLPLDGIALPGCCGWSIALIAGGIASLIANE